MLADIDAFLIVVPREEHIPNPQLYLLMLNLPHHTASWQNTIAPQYPSAIIPVIHDKITSRNLHEAQSVGTVCSPHGRAAPEI